MTKLNATIAAIESSLCVWEDDILVPMYETPEDAYDAYLAGELTEDELFAIGETFDD